MGSEENQIVENVDITFFQEIQKGENLCYILFENEKKTEATILEIKEFPAFHGISRVPFAVMVSVEESTVYPQKIYPVLNLKNQVAEVFLVPVAREKGCLHYQAVFS